MSIFVHLIPNALLGFIVTKKNNIHKSLTQPASIIVHGSCGGEEI